MTGSLDEQRDFQKLACIKELAMSSAVQSMTQAADDLPCLAVSQRKTLGLLRVQGSRMAHELGMYGTFQKRTSKLPYPTPEAPGPP